MHPHLVKPEGNQISFYINNSTITPVYSTSIVENGVRFNTKISAIFDYMPCTEEEWLQKSQQFAEKWNFPHCIGALDGKHVLIKAPKQRGSLYHNYKGTHSVVLMALADAEYKFQYINVGCFGRISDGGVFNACSLSNKLADNSLGIPTPRPLPGRTKPVPFVIVADDAFAMKSYIMKPYAFRNKEYLTIDYHGHAE
ncbi:unnamed protein product [Acanthoscelides obtectus]|uniref:DDE Tnp4 domain-containing protein n=1 Tax=Acanthoscelides obtectus TaxID=200917 RepID=A0A9P0Q837_ACAOB|nr:unnamed protein product [Acanthoscelides obtectus]CAK1627019.1 hypothetical protein AOBTE_LOCUS4227 [Acanthoscelides obtectus]